MSGRLIICLTCLLLVLPALTIFGQPDSREVIARRGDGIHKLLSEHGLNPVEYTEKFIELNRKNIGSNNTLFAGIIYLIPHADGETNVSDESSVSGSEPEIRNYEIFGSGYSRVEIKGDELSGTVYYLMSGHGGPDPGASGRYGPYTLTEDEYAYDVTLRLARNLIQHGALVYLITRDNNDGIRDMSILPEDSDETCYPSLKIPSNQVARLRQRTNAVNSLYARNRGKYQRLIVLHLDSRSRGENIDVFFYHHVNSKTGEKLATQIHRTFTEKYRKFQPNRSYRGTVTSRSGLYVIRNTHPPVVFIELGNISNSRDQRRFVLYDNRQALANWITEGIITDYMNR